LSLEGFSSQTVRQIASHYTDYAILVQRTTCNSTCYMSEWWAAVMD